MPRFLLVFCVILFFNFNYALCQCVTDVNFNNNWYSYGSETDWTVLNDSVVELVDEVLPIDPIFFVGGENLQNTTIKGKFMVTSAFNDSDKDFIGFVLGYQYPYTNPFKYKFILFDWKGQTDSYDGYTGFEGMTVSNVNMEISHYGVSKYFWGHTDVDGKFDVLQRRNTAGWEYNQKYDFEVTYTSTRLVIKIDGVVMFDLEGCFPNGRFGFYCYSQINSRFEGFDYQLAVDYSTSEDIICEGESVDFSAYASGCGAGYENLNEWIWDFGDGLNSNDINPNHIFDQAGNYTVKFKVSDLLNCTDSVSHSIQVNPIPEVYITGETFVNFNQNAMVEISGDYDDVLWNDGTFGYSKLIENLRNDTLLSVSVTKEGCENTAEHLIKVGGPPVITMPNAFKPGSVNNSEFKPITTSTERFKMYILNRWGKMVYESNSVNEGWDGNLANGSACPQGVYIWKLVYDSFDENYDLVEKANEGTVILIR